MGLLSGLFGWISGLFRRKPEPAPTPTPVPTDINDALLLLHNNSRKSVGVNPLTMSSQLSLAAQMHAEWMAKNNTLDHVGRNGSTLSDRITTTGYKWSSIGENIAMGYSSPQSVANGWLNSSGHRKNIQNPTYTHVGFGIATASNGQKYWTTDFARPRIAGETIETIYLSGYLRQDGQS